ncbi:MAG TPA: RNA polymerase-binding protein DksA [Rhodanobacteraceae bacterium]
MGALQPYRHGGTCTADASPLAGGNVAHVLTDPLAGYRPSACEPYMNAHQLAYFKARLVVLRSQLEAAALREPPARECGDTMDHAVAAHAEQRFWEEQARQRAALENVRCALRRIDDGSYGFCAETGRAIGLSRLDANPAAMFAVDVQARRERDAR